MNHDVLQACFDADRPRGKRPDGVCSKRWYSSRKQAKQALGRHRRHHPSYAGHVYECPLCNCWHFGRSRLEIRRDVERMNPPTDADWANRIVRAITG